MACSGHSTKKEKKHVKRWGAYQRTHYAVRKKETEYYASSLMRLLVNINNEGFAFFFNAWAFPSVRAAACTHSKTTPSRRWPFSGPLVAIVNKTRDKMARFRYSDDNWGQCDISFHLLEWSHLLSSVVTDRSSVNGAMLSKFRNKRNPTWKGLRISFNGLPCAIWFQVRGGKHSSRFQGKHLTIAHYLFLFPFITSRTIRSPQCLLPSYTFPHLWWSSIVLTSKWNTEELVWNRELYYHHSQKGNTRPFEAQRRNA